MVSYGVYGLQLCEHIVQFLNRFSVGRRDLNDAPNEANGAVNTRAREQRLADVVCYLCVVPEI